MKNLGNFEDWKKKLDKKINLENARKSRSVLWKYWYKTRDTYHETMCFLKTTDPIQEIKWFYQRGTRGYSNRDCWSLNSYICFVISGGVKMMAKFVHSYPPEFKSEKEWIKVLEHISKSFKMMGDCCDGECMPYDKKYFNKNIDYIKVMSKEDTKYMEEGFILLQKYYNSLWD